MNSDLNQHSNERNIRTTTFTQAVRLLALVVLLCVISGCNNPFNPDTIKNREEITRNNNTPRNVLENLEASYNKQDIDLFMSCLSESFRFELLSVEKDEIGLDMDGDGIKDSWWDFSQEVEYHRNLFSTGSTDGTIPSPDQIYLNLQIPHEEAWMSENVPGREDWVVIPVYFNLVLTLYGTSNITADGYARFYLRPEDNEWKIIIWRDESNI